MKKVFFLSGVILAFSFYSCSSNSSYDMDDVEDETSDVLVIDVESTNFTSDLNITTVPCTLSDGTVTDCYQITTAGLPSDHDLGPWCPTNIDDGADLGGIWLEGGEVYDVDGAFIAGLDEFYDGFGYGEWQMYDTETGEITVTETEDDCINAANPNVGDAYANFCVECLPSYVSDLTVTWTIPISPVLQTTQANFAAGPGGTSAIPSTRGVALNGVEFSAAAPTDNILSALTIAPFDDAGGHINVNQGYHYHAATGLSTGIEQIDNHAKLIGYAMDGHGIYEMLDGDGTEPTDLDACRGHYDDIRGYHYHVDAAGSNNFINCLKGAYVVN